MDMRYFYAIMSLVFLSSAAHAGAWLRTEGETFTSFSYGALVQKDTDTRSSDQRFFLEYGQTTGRTLGAKLDLKDGELDQAEAFLRLPIRDDDRPVKIAAEIGLGLDWDQSESDPYVRLGGSVGRGFALGKTRSGWVNVDISLLASPSRRAAREKLDLTFGVNLTDQFQVMAQGFYETNDTGESTTLSTSVIYSPKFTAAQIVFGVEDKRSSQDETGLRLSIWRAF